MTAVSPRDNTYADLEACALRVREHIIRMATDGGCFIGASLSCADLLVYLYQRVLNVVDKGFEDPDRDYLLLSKGHDVPALYGTFVELGLMAPERLANHLKTHDSIYWHPNRAVPGVEFHSGSLGHLLSVGMGVAMDLKLRGQETGRRPENNVYVVLGDGELDEGSIWEGCLVAAAHKLDHLVAVVDRNAFQANIETEKLIPLEPLEEKFAAFGWQTARVDGHNFAQLEDVFERRRFEPGRPRVIIADTVRGKGLPSIERRADRWFVNFTADEVRQLLEELHGQGQANLASETLHVR